MTAYEFARTSTEAAEIVKVMRAHAAKVMETDRKELIDAFSLFYLAEHLADSNKEKEERA